MPDKSVMCADCGNEFVFTEGEQEYYQERGFTEPKRCKACRDLRKRNRDGGQGRGGGQRY